MYLPFSIGYNLLIKYKGGTQMSFGQNLQFLREMHEGMTQEELAEKMNVSRQTISKCELNSAFPEMEKAIALCKIFSCSLDELIRENMNLGNESYINIRVEKIPSFQYVSYTIISKNPEDDAKKYIKDWAISYGIENAEIIGWDFPFVSQEQINIYHMHGYTAACIIQNDIDKACSNMVAQASQEYAVITIKEPFRAPFSLIPNSYKTLIRYMKVNGLSHKQTKEVLPCFEKEYYLDGVSYMDVYIAIEP